MVGVASNPHNIVLKINEATFVLSIINIGQNLTNTHTHPFKLFKLISFIICATLAQKHPLAFPMMCRFFLLDIDNIVLVLQQNRLRWYGHVLRKDDDDWVKKCMEYEVEGQGQEEDQRGPGERLLERTVKLVN